jgi:hypothetical protein
MKVKAKEYGQYKGRMMETGTVFDIKDSSELAPWMEKLETQKDKEVREWLEGEKKGKANAK